MKMTKYVLMALMGLQGVQANPVTANAVINCFQQQKLAFVVKTLTPSVHSVTPYDDAVLILNQPQAKALPLNLLEQKQGGLSTQQNYAIYGGGKLVLSEILKPVIGCGRRLCDYKHGEKEIFAKLIAINGQEYVYNCSEKN